MYRLKTYFCRTLIVLVMLYSNIEMFIFFNLYVVCLLGVCFWGCTGQADCFPGCGKSCGWGHYPQQLHLVSDAQQRLLSSPEPKTLYYIPPGQWDLHCNTVFCLGILRGVNGSGEGLSPHSSRVWVLIQRSSYCLCWVLNVLLVLV